MTDPAGPGTQSAGGPGVGEVGVRVVVLAAGEGTRMRSPLPKVLHALCGRTMLGHVLAAATELDPREIRVVVGHDRALVAATLPAGVTPVVQDVQGGTGHAVRTALQDAPGAEEGTVVVLPGDAPLLTGGTLRALVAAHRGSGAAATLLTTRIADPTGYGRVLRGPDGGVQAVVEQADADEATLALDEVAVSVYAFAAEPLTAALGKLSTDNAQGQEYLTDVVSLLRGEGLPVGSHRVPDPAEVIGVNDQVQLAAARRTFRDRLVRAAMLAGVTVIDPETTWMGVEVSYEPGAVVHQNTQLQGRTHLGAGCEIGPNSTLLDTVVGPGATVAASTCTGAEIGARAGVGPYAHLRPGTVLGPDTKVGAFAETKNARLGAGSKIPHLAYVGDATVGARSNIGAGTIVVNYDGVAKHRTQIGDDARVGANNSLVAPVRIGDGAYTGADAVVRHDVPDGALSFSQNQQVTQEGWAARKRPPEGEHAAPDDHHEGAP